MIRSMTAFARCEARHPWGSLTWELRSVNHRYLEPYLRLPDELRGLDAPVRERLAAKLKRGKVECMLRVQSDAGQAQLSLNLPLLARLVEAAEEVRALLPMSAPLSPMDVLRWPGAIQSQDVDQQAVQEAALVLLDEAIEELVATRAREGARLKTFIEQRCSAMAAQVVQVRLRLPEVSTRIRERLLARLADVREHMDPARLEQEMVMYTQRMDVEEELDRLGAHLLEVERVLDQQDAMGRRLDFLMQELNREANTLGSKSLDVETTRASVEIKVLIEQMREQVQNIE